MKNKLKKFLCSVLSAIIYVGILFVPTYATENTGDVTAFNSDETSVSIAPQSSTIFYDAGVIEGTSKQFTITVPKSTTYTFTMSVRNSSGSDGVWTIFQKQNSWPTIDRVILGSFQQRYPLTAGTWYLRLTPAPQTCTYAISIHES